MIEIKCDTSKLEKQLMSLIKDVVEASEETIKEGCLTIKEDAKELCPVDDGELRASIKDEQSNHNNVIEGTVGTDKEYAPFVEFGTRYRVPSPFLYPSFNKHKDTFKSNLIENISIKLK